MSQGQFQKEMERNKRGKKKKKKGLTNHYCDEQKIMLRIKIKL